MCVKKGVSLNFFITSLLLTIGIMENIYVIYAEKYNVISSLFTSATARRFYSWFPNMETDFKLPWFPNKNPALYFN